MSALTLSFLASLVHAFGSGSILHGIGTSITAYPI